MKINQTIKITTKFHCSLFYSLFFVFSFCSFRILDPIDSNVIISYKDIKIGCMNMENLQPVYIIRNVTDFNKLLKKESNTTISCDFEKIDFNNYSLIGSVKICNGSIPPIITKKVNYNESEKKIYFQVEISEQGTHSKQIQTASYWVLIPKIKTDIDVISNINLHFLSKE